MSKKTANHQHTCNSLIDSGLGHHQNLVFSVRVLEFLQHRHPVCRGSGGYTEQNDSKSQNSSLGMSAVAFGIKKLYKPIYQLQIIMLVRDILKCINSVYLKDSAEEKPLHTWIIQKTYL